MTAVIRISALWGALLLATISTTWASDRTIDLRVGFGSSLVLDKAFETVLIGNSDVVDVHTPDNRLVVLEPLAPGATNLVFLGRQKYRDRQHCDHGSPIGHQSGRQNSVRLAGWAFPG
jgi:Flp pilus assembly secretin CpaC